MRAASVSLALALVACTLAQASCTVRRSQTMVGRIVKAERAPRTAEQRGFEFSLGGYSGPLGGITITEPRSAVELHDQSCATVLGEVDYRASWFFIPILFNPTFVRPQVRVTEYCVE